MRSSQYLYHNSIFTNFVWFLCSAIVDDGIREESEDEDKANPDERLPQSIQDKRIAPDNEFSDSEDEGPGGNRRDNRSFKGRKRPRLDPAKPESDIKTDDSKAESKCSLTYLDRRNAD